MSSSSSYTESDEQTCSDEDTEMSLCNTSSAGSETSLFSDASDLKCNSSAELRMAIEPLKYSEEEVKNIVHRMMSDKDHDDRRAASIAFRKMFHEKKTLSSLFGIFTPGTSDDVRLEVVKLLTQLCARSQTVKEATDKIKPFCADVLKYVQFETNESVKKELFNLIGRIGARRKDAWPELQKFIQESFASGDRDSQMNALEMMVCSSETGCRPLIEWSSVEIFIVKSILGSDLTLRKPSIQVFSSFISKVPEETVKKILSCLIKLAKEVSTGSCGTYSSNANDDGAMRGIETACNGEHAAVLSCLSRMVDWINDISSKYVQRMFAICTETAMNRLVCGECSNSLVLLASLTGKYEDVIPSHLIPDIVTSLLLGLAKEARIHAGQWMKHNPNDADSMEPSPRDASLIFYVFLDIGGEMIGDVLIKACQKFEKDADWANRAAAMICMTNLLKREEFRGGYSVQYLIDRATCALKDKNSYVRKTAADLICRIGRSDEFKTDSLSLNEMISSLVTIATDSNPRMRDYAVPALYCWIVKGRKEGIDIEFLVAPHYAVLIPVLTKRISTGCPKDSPKELSLMDCRASGHALAMMFIHLLARSMGRAFKPYFPEFEVAAADLLTRMDRAHKEFELLRGFSEDICRVVEEGILRRVIDDSLVNDIRVPPSDSEQSSSNVALGAESTIDYEDEETTNSDWDEDDDEPCRCVIS